MSKKEPPKIALVSKRRCGRNRSTSRLPGGAACVRQPTKLVVMPVDRDTRGERRLPPGARASRALATRPGERAGGVRIRVDVHEQRSGIAEGLAALGARVEVSRLAAGDYVVGRGTVVERKRVVDLHTSVSHARFWPQLARLREAFDRPYLLIEGTDIDRGSLHPAAVRSLCLAVIDLGVPVLRSYQQTDSAAWIYRLALRCQTRRKRTQWPPARDPRRPRMLPGLSNPESLLASVPGISASLAGALLSRFGSVAGVVDAGPLAWLEVPGLGPTRAKVLAETLSMQLPDDAALSRAARRAAAKASPGRPGSRV
jgi:ERCC4-type nuclease